MKIYISYFYQIRNFPSNLIPISTAKWDPRWYHQFKDDSFVFKDRRNVLNGIRCELFAPNEKCGQLCKGKDYCFSHNISPSNCNFLKEYRKQLEQINFNNFITQLCELIKRTGIENANVALIVYEAPNNQCSERNEIIKWFNHHGYAIDEF